MNIYQIKRALRGKRLTFVNVENILQSLGYSVVLFNTYPGDMELERYELEDKKGKLKAFTYSKTAHIIFVDANLHADDRLYLLLHELGHIVLGHVGDGKLVTRNQILIDIEADSFAYSIIRNDKRSWLYVLLSAVIIYALLITAVYINARIVPVHTYTKVVTQTQPQATEQNTDTVFVTPTGKKYHKQNCMYSRGKNLTELTRTQAENIYTPCSVCNP